MNTYSYFTQQIIGTLLYLVPICIYMFHKMVKMNIVGIFVTLGLQLDKHIVCIFSNTHFILNKMIYNNTITILLHHKLKCWLRSTKKQPTVIKQSSVVNYLMQSVTSTWLHITDHFILGYVVRRLVNNHK